MIEVNEQRLESDRTGVAHRADGELTQRLLATTPFEPTKAQIRAIEEVGEAMAATRPMNVLLQGDVGSGKTLVAVHERHITASRASLAKRRSTSLSISTSANPADNPRASVLTSRGAPPPRSPRADLAEGFRRSAVRDSRWSATQRSRFAPGSEPPLKREFYHGPDDWKTNVVENFGLILSQDFQNMGEVQQGMKSRGFRGSRTNPLQESTISNFHRVLREYVGQ